jgi:hypothetical protein
MATIGVFIELMSEFKRCIDEFLMLARQWFILINVIVEHTTYSGRYCGNETTIGPVEPSDFAWTLKP